MSKEQVDQLLPGSHDGIQEYDNKLPNWWLFTLYIAIVYAVVYWGWYHTLDAGVHQTEAYAMEVERQEALAASRALVIKTDDEFKTLMGDAAVTEAGKALYTANCVACHEANGGGKIGPNLTDDYWMHGGGPADIFKTVALGVPAKGMLAWKPVLGQEKCEQLTAYLMTLRGTNVSGGKDPQGELYTANSSKKPEGGGSGGQ